MSSGRKQARQAGAAFGGPNAFGGLPEAWALAGVLALVPVVGALLGLLVDRLAGVGPLFLVLGTAGGVVLAARGFVRALRSWTTPEEGDPT